MSKIAARYTTLQFYTTKTLNKFFKKKQQLYNVGKQKLSDEHTLTHVLPDNKASDHGPLAILSPI